MARKTPAPYMTLAAANFFLKYAKARGVSKVARGESKSAVTKIGFMQAYAKAKGNHKKLQTMMATPRQTWDERRNNFVARHMAQVTKRGEDLYETAGKYKGWPTRRHLGLIMWAMTPDPRGVGNLIARERGLKTRTTRANGLSSRRTSARAGTGKGIRIPSEWIYLVSQALAALEDAIPSYTARHGLAEPRADGFVNLPLDALSPRIRELLTDRPNMALRVEITLYASFPARVAGALAVYSPVMNRLWFAVGQTDPSYIRHELVHVLQTNADRNLVATGRVLPQDEGGPKSAVGQRRAYWRRGQSPSTPGGWAGPSTPNEFEAYVEQLSEDVDRIVTEHYEMIFDYYADPAWDGEMLPQREHIGSINAQIRDLAATISAHFEDPRARRDAMQRIVNRGAARISTIEPLLQGFLARVRGERRARTVANPRYTSARRDDPKLWERVKAAITRGTKGGKAGQWSARKAQFAVAEYQRRGGGYIGPKSPRNALAKWTREEWGTKSGRASLKTGERYLPKAAREALTPAEYAETTRAKRAGLRRGEQFTRQPKRIARKTAKHRK
jgi:hypothetical protein